MAAEYVGASVIDHLWVQFSNSGTSGKAIVVPLAQELSLFVSKDLRLTVGAAFAESNSNKHGRSDLSILLDGAVCSMCCVI